MLPSGIILSECYCVCHSKIVMSNDIPECVCEDGRIPTDTCGGNYIKYHGKSSCNDFEKMNRMQCVCNPGYGNGDKNSADITECILRKYAMTYSLGSYYDDRYYAFVEEEFYTGFTGLIEKINGEFSALGWSRIDAVAYKVNEYYWFFKNNQTAIGRKESSNPFVINPGYPKNISDVWKGNSKLTYVTAAVFDQGKSKMYLTQGNVLYVYSDSNIFEKETTVEAMFPGIVEPFNSPDSICMTGSNLFLFVKGNMTQLYLNGALSGKPQKIEALLPNIPPLYIPN